ncbi:DUF4010 domain-containing protein [Novosphingobium sp. ST904]|uniref:MgtC/SapB family protein n=1 Tax=Novosphingobium sp. ST904 TaxID=1684385 RepID=UPI00104907A9|nr:DUF4010 domain-containing protein [Novosphingobium sp. ST904]TCM43128.1 uncharacterized membrane protein (DUF4010 family) [Novosphingobium sp. ST904]
MPTGQDFSHLIALAVSLALGLLVGLQRGWATREQADGTRFAGIRTFALLALAGGVAGVMFADAPGPATVLIAAAAALVIAGYVRDARVNDRVSGTSGVVALLTLVSGLLVGMGERLIGTAIAVVMVLLLAMREQLHGWIDRLSQREVLSIARFALIALVILPLLPDRNFGPFDAWNPRKLWLIVVFVSGFSFAGYFATRIVGAARGIIATAAAGALVSSTAVTASIANRLKEDTIPAPVLAAAISVSSVVMFLRVMVLAGLLAPAALPMLAKLIAPGLVVSLGCAAFHLHRTRFVEAGDTSHEMTIRNPFDIGPALMLTGLVMVLTVASLWVLQNFGDRGLALVLAISGTVDVDSAIITMGGLAGRTLDARTAGLVLAVPVALNTLFKGGVVASVAGWEKGRQGIIPLIASAIAVGLAWLLLR